MSRSVLKALEMIELLAPAQHGLSLSEVAERTGFPMSTAHRLLATLAGQSYVVQDPQTRRYYLGSKLFALQAQYSPRRHLDRIAPPYLRRLMRQLNAAVNLSVLVGQEAVYLETVSPDSIFSLRAPPGTRIPLHCTAAGKMLLAHLPLEDCEIILSSLKLERFTPHTITSLADLRAELLQVAQRGYAVDNQEYVTGVRCVAAPVRDYTDKVVATISASDMAERLPDERIEPVVTLVLETCWEISQALGYQGGERETPGKTR